MPVTETWWSQLCWDFQHSAVLVTRMTTPLCHCVIALNLLEVMQQACCFGTAKGSSCSSRLLSTTTKLMDWALSVGYAQSTCILHEFFCCHQQSLRASEWPGYCSHFTNFTYLPGDKFSWFQFWSCDMRMGRKDELSYAGCSPSSH